MSHGKDSTGGLRALSQGPLDGGARELRALSQGPLDGGALPHGRARGRRVGLRRRQHPSRAATGGRSSAARLSATAVTGRRSKGSGSPVGHGGGLSGACVHARWPWCSGGPCEWRGAAAGPHRPGETELKARVLVSRGCARPADFDSAKIKYGRPILIKGKERLAVDGPVARVGRGPFSPASARAR